MSEKNQGRLVGLLASTLVTIALLSGCSPSIGQMKTEALDEIAAMDGLSQSMKDEASWRISDFNEKELVERYLAEVRAENETLLAEASAKEELTQAWIDTPLTVVSVTDHFWNDPGNEFVVDENGMAEAKSQAAVGTTLTLLPDGTLDLDPLLGEIMEVDSWSQESGETEIRLCNSGTGECWPWWIGAADSEQGDLLIQNGYGGMLPAIAYLKIG